jgi:hypothetical protein
MVNRWKSCGPNHPFAMSQHRHSIQCCLPLSDTIGRWRSQPAWKTFGKRLRGRKGLHLTGITRETVGINRSSPI